MKVSSFAVARPVYYDRNSATKGRTYGASGIAPHSTTVRWTYTVPAGKAAYVESLNAMVFRDGTATVANIAQMLIYIQTTDTATTIQLQVREYKSTLYIPNITSQSNIAFIKAGDVVYAASADPSTGGTYTYTADMKLTEFDA